MLSLDITNEPIPQQFTSHRSGESEKNLQEEEVEKEKKSEMTQNCFSGEENPLDSDA